MKRSLIAFGVGAMLLCVGTAKADSIGSISLGSCTGGTGCPAATYSFDVSNTSATLAIKIDGPVTSTNDYITAVDLGITSANNTVSGLTLTQSPTLPLGDIWNITSAGALTSGGSCGTGNGGFICADSTPTDALLIATGQTYTWKWTYSALPSIQAAGDVHIGAEYGPNQGNNKGLIVSTTVPEPSSIALLALGLLAILALSTKKARTAA
ncbi:MAG TPA: PEP-CTERM sorting domain-containing protein [Candidatus Acidoferrales bacterium]|nr:PEP-CTERM sorting domain-containing protein [Candidatus Acidoferrales bacterium]